MLNRAYNFFYQMVYPELTPVNQTLLDALTKILLYSEQLEIIRDIRLYQNTLHGIFNYKQVLNDNICVDDPNHLSIIFSCAHDALKKDIDKLEEVTCSLLTHQQILTFKNEILKQNDCINIYVAMLMNELLKSVYAVSRGTRTPSDEKNALIKRVKYLNCDDISDVKKTLASLSNFKTISLVDNIFVAATHWEALLNNTIQELFNENDHCIQNNMV